MTLDHRLYRTAAPAAPRAHLRRTFGWLTLVWTFALVLLPATARAAEVRLGVRRRTLPGARPLGAAVLMAASALGLRSAVAMARGEGTPVPFEAAALLVDSGPYARVRNPMAVSGVSQAAGVALLVGSPTYYLVAPAGALMWHLVIRPSEERFLERTFGEPYRAYRRRVPLWVPRCARPRLRR